MGRMPFKVLGVTCASTEAFLTAPANEMLCDGMTASANNFAGKSFFHISIISRYAS